jgi:hypothetical protein
MNRVSTSQRFGICCVLSLIAGAPASKPAPGVDTSIAGDQIHFPAPPADQWSAIKPDPAADAITFINQGRDGQIQMQLLPKDASVDSDIAMNVAVAVVKQLKATHEQNHDLVVLQPKIIKDRRFAFCIHEKFKVGDNVMDRLHIYKAVGPRVLLLTANSLAKDEEKITAIQKAGQEMLDGAKFNRKALKKSD